MIIIKGSHFAFRCSFREPICMTHCLGGTPLVCSPSIEYLVKDIKEDGGNSLVTGGSWSHHDSSSVWSAMLGVWYLRTNPESVSLSNHPRVKQTTANNCQFNSFMEFILCGI